MDEIQIYLIIIAMSVVTILPRIIPVGFLAGKQMPEWLVSFVLKYARNLRAFSDADSSTPFSGVKAASMSRPVQSDDLRPPRWGSIARPSHAKPLRDGFRRDGRPRPAEACLLVRRKHGFGREVAAHSMHPRAWRGRRGADEDFPRRRAVRRKGKPRASDDLGERDGAAEMSPPRSAGFLRSKSAQVRVLRFRIRFLNPGAKRSIWTSILPERSSVDPFGT